QQDEECDPTAVEAVAAACEPERAHGISFDHGRMTADTADGQPKNQCATRLPSKIEAPAQPEGAGPQIGDRKHHAEDEGNRDACSAGPRLQSLQACVESCETDGCAHGANDAAETLEAVAAKGDFFHQRSGREKQDVA